MLGWVVAFACALSVGCLQPSYSTCEDGTLCPTGTVCGGSPWQCLDPAQLERCTGLDEAAPCEFDGRAGACRGGVCIQFTCGDGIAMAPEQCDRDDLGTIDDCGELGYYGGGTLSCADDCTYDASACVGGVCGDGTVNGPEACEPTVSAPGSCVDLDFYDAGAAPCNGECRFDVSACTGWCGDGLLNGRESCDAGVGLLETCRSFGDNYGWIECRACVPYIDDCHRFGWQRVPTEATGFVRSIHGTGRTDVWVAGDFGMLLHNTGARFAVVTPAVSGDFSAVRALAPDEAYLAARDGSIQRWDGSAWTTVFMDAAWTFEAMWSGGPDHLLAAGNLGLLRWDGTSWTPLGGPPGNPASVRIWGLTPDDYYVIDSSGRLHRHTSAGWATTTLTAGVQAVWGRAADDLYAAVAISTTASATYHFDGQTWSSALPMIGIFGTLRAITGTATGVHWVGAGVTAYFDGEIWSFLSGASSGLGDLVTTFDAGPTEVYAGGSAGLFVYAGAMAFDSGVVPAAPAALTSIWAASRSSQFAAAGDVYRYTGAQWNPVLTGRNLRAVWGASATDVFAVGDAGAAYRLSGTWSRMTTPTMTPALTAVAGTTGDDVWAVGAGGTILRWNGVQWSKMSSPTTQDLHGVWAASATEAVAVGAAGTILRWNGTQWAAEAAPTSYTLYGVYGFASTDVIAVGDGGTVLRWKGAGWTAATTGTTARLRAVWGPAAADVFVVGAAGTILHDDGYGLTTVTVDNVGQREQLAVGGTTDEIHVGSTAVTSTTSLVRTAAWKRRVPPP